ncbi:unnamed protein product [Closterium sp. NIES-54]
MATTTVLRQRQPSVQESLSLQQLREWAIRWGSPVGGASRARAGGAGAGGPRTRRPGGGAWCATTGGPCESTLAGSAAGRRRGSGGGQQRQQRPPETLSPQELCEWAVRWGSPGGGAWGTSAGGGEALGGVEAAILGAVDSASTCADPEEALHTFTLDSGASRCVFRDITTVTPLIVPVPVTLADPSWGSVVARGATILPCPAAPLGLLTGLHLPLFAKNLVATSVLQDQWVTVTQLGGELVAICTDSRTDEHLATFTRRPRSGMYTLTTESALVAESGQVATSVEVPAPSPEVICTSLPSLRRGAAVRHSSLLVSSYHRPSTDPTHGLGGECYFLLVVDDYTRYTTVFPLQSKADVHGVLIQWIRAVCLQLCARFQQDLPVLQLHSDRGGEFFSHLLEDFCGAEGIVQSYTLPAFPQQNGIAKGHICLFMEVARTSMIHVAAPHFLWPFAARYAVEQLNLRPRVSHPETSPTLWWTGEVGDASAFRVWGSLSLVCDLPAGKLSPRTLRCMFLGFPTDALPWQFYHPGSRRVLSSRDVTFDESVYFYCLHPRCSSPVPLPPPSLVDDPPSVAPLPPLGPARSRVSQVDPPPLVEPLGISSDTSGPGEGGDPTHAAIVTPRRSARLAVPPGFQPRPSSSSLQPVAVKSGAAGGGTTGGAGSGGVECPSGTGGTGGTGAGGPATRQQETLSLERLREWAVQWGSPGGGARHAHSPRAGGTGGAAAVGTAAGSPSGGAGRAGAGGTGGTGAAGGAGGASSRGASPGGAGAGVPGASPCVPGTGCTRAAGGAGGSRGASPGGASAGVPDTGGTGAAEGAGGAGTTGGAGGATGCTTRGTGVSGARRQESLSPLQLREWVVCWGSPGGGAGGTGLGVMLLLELEVLGSQPQLLPGSPLPAPAPHTEVIASLTTRHEPQTRASTPERREPETRAFVPTRVRCVRCPCAPAVPGTHDMTLRPSSVPQRVVLPSPPASSLPHILEHESDLVCAASPTVTRLLATVVTNPSFESAAASALVTELVDFAALCRLDYAASLVFYSSYPSSVRGDLALGIDVLEDRQFELEYLAATAPHLASTLLCPEGDQDALDILTPRTYAEAITGSPPALRYVARCFNQREGVEFFHTFSPTPKMTTLRVLLHDAALRDNELHSLDFSTAFLQVYGLRQAPREWHDTLRTTLAALGFSPSTADPSLFLRTDTSLPPFYVLVYADDLVFAAVDTEALALVKAELLERHTCTYLGELRSYLGLQITLTQSHMVQQVLQRFAFTWSSPQPTPLSTGHSLAAPPSDESVEPSGPYPELVGCLIYMMTCTRPDLAYPLSLLARYVAPAHRAWGLCLEGRVHCEAEFYAGAMAAQELRWLTYLLTDLGEQPRSPPIRYVDNKAMIALCPDQRLEHIMKHVALRYFLTRELQQCGQLRLAYVATQANTADVFTKALGSSDHKRFCTALGLVPTLPHLLDCTCTLCSSHPTAPCAAAATGLGYFSHAVAAAVGVIGAAGDGGAAAAGAIGAAAGAVGADAGAVSAAAGAIGGAAGAVGAAAGAVGAAAGAVGACATATTGGGEGIRHSVTK